MRFRDSRMGMWALLLSGVLTACEVDPDDPLFLAGSAQNPDGTPAAGVSLTLERSLGPAPHLVPVWDRPSADVPVEPLQTLISREDGSWRAEVLSFDSITSWKGAPIARLLRVSHRAREDLEPVRVSFTLGDDDAELPPLRQWEGRLELVTEETTMAFSYPPAPKVPPSPLQPAEEEAPQQVRNYVVLESETGPAYRQLADDTQAKLRSAYWAYLLEDFTLQARASVRASGRWYFDSLLKGPTGGATDYVVETSLPPLPLQNGAKHAFSRGALCPDIAPAGPCPLTDGSLEAVRIPEGAALELRLPEPVTVQGTIWYVIRGMLAPEMKLLPVYVLYEGADTWTPMMLMQLRRDDEPVEEESFQAGGNVLETSRRLVAIRFTAPGKTARDVISLREISVFLE